jgi:2-dehydropantoate 2-reductase
MLGHWPEQIARLRSTGLTLIHPGGRRSLHHFQVRNDPSQIPLVDLALVLVKSYQTRRAALEIKQMLAADGLAVTLQNGLGNVEILAAVLGPARVTQGITAVGATMQGPGVVRFAGHGPTHLAHNLEKPALIREFARLLDAADFETNLAADLNSLVWGKLVINAGINPLTALLRVPNGFLAENNQARTQMFAAAEETAAVAQALGISLPYPDASQRVLKVARATATNNSSMLQDILRGSQTEIKAISGEVVAHGRQIHLPTPINEEYLRLISSLPTHQPGLPITSKIEPLQKLLEQKIANNLYK